jgi:hypothetical protein
MAAGLVESVHVLSVTLTVRFGFDVSEAEVCFDVAQTVPGVARRHGDTTATTTTSRRPIHRVGRRVTGAKVFGWIGRLTIRAPPNRRPGSS